MKVQCIEDPELLEKLGQSTGPRTQGVVHVSEIYKILMKRLQPKRFTDSPMDMRRIEIGLVFENMLERGLAERHATVRPGEIVSDEGIWMSPDGVNPDLQCGEEFKSSYMSCRKGLTDEYGNLRDQFYHWGVQMMAYAKWLGVNVFMLRVLFICGDYSYPIAPQFKSYRLEFTDDEINENWAMLMLIAREEGLL